MKEIDTGLSKWFNTVNDVDKLVNIDTKQNNKQNRNTMAREILFKAKLADTVMKLKTQKELAAASMVTGKQLVTPPTEPPGRAPNGQAYQL